MKNVGDRSKKRKQPWPTKDAMEQIYKKKLWGGNQFDFYSGSGSHNPKFVDPYIDAISFFLKSFENPISICDLGCGDFNIGQELVRYSKKYIAVDIVADLIERNKKMFQESNLEFQCLDISVDELPSADCALVRQVLQHLSNAEVQCIVEKLSDFKYVVLTEHIPEGDFIANTEIQSGQGIRLKKQSGINLLAAPFNFKVKREKQLLSVTASEYKGIIVTTLYETI